jgi:hypothetical protein
MKKHGEISVDLSAERTETELHAALVTAVQTAEGM